jgi:hypothetical protein
MKDATLASSVIFTKDAVVMAGHSEGSDTLPFIEDDAWLAGS